MIMHVIIKIVSANWNNVQGFLNVSVINFILSFALTDAHCTSQGLA